MCQRIFGISIFTMTRTQQNYQGVALLGCTAFLLVAHTQGQDCVPMTCAINLNTGDISHHLEKTCRFHQLWSAGWMSQSLSSSCMFHANHLKTQKLLTVPGCYRTSVLNRHWIINAGAQPCQEIRERPSVFDPQLTEIPVSSLIPLACCVLSWHIKGKMKRQRRAIFPCSTIFQGHCQQCCVWGTVFPLKHLLQEDFSLVDCYKMPFCIRVYLNKLFWATQKKVHQLKTKRN